MAFIKPEFISQVEERCDIVEVLSSYLNLKQDSGGLYKCCCPFHTEKTPSFKIYPHSNSYHCFGCHKSGDVVSFLKDYLQISYPEAIENLAARYGMTVEYEKSNKSQEELIRANNNFDKGLELLNQVCAYFQKSLQENSQAMEYLLNRGLTKEIIQEFRIGFSPIKDDFLLKNLAPIFGEDLLTQTGIIKIGEYGKYPFFRGRIMFPIINTKGRVIGFGARFLGTETERKEKETAKYINSQETQWFKKSEELYGLFNALNSPARKKGEIVVCEGYADVVQMNQQGINNAVAALGTAFGEKHLLKLKNFSTINFCFDADEAGYKAAVKTLEIVFKNFDEQKIYKFTFLKNKENPNEKEDPDSFLRKYGKDEFIKELNNGISPEEFLDKILNVQDVEKLSLAEKTQKIDNEASKWLSYLNENSKAATYKLNLEQRFKNQGIFLKELKPKNYSKPKIYTDNYKAVSKTAVIKKEELQQVDALIEPKPIDVQIDEKLKREYAKKIEEFLLFLQHNPQYYLWQEFKIYNKYINKYFPKLQEILFLCSCGATTKFLNELYFKRRLDFFPDEAEAKLLERIKNQLYHSEEIMRKAVEDTFLRFQNEEQRLAKISLQIKNI